MKRKDAWIQRMRLSAMLLAVASHAAADISIDVGALDVPVGASTTIQLYLEPTGEAVSGVGTTIVYDPLQLAVEFVGSEARSLGGVDTVRLVHHRPGRIVVAAGRAGASGYAPTEAEPFVSLRVRRLSAEDAAVVMEETFQAAPGGQTFESVNLPQVVFGVVTDDTDADWIRDEWEYHYFDGLGVAGADTDFDGDGSSDVNEFRTGSHPRVPFLSWDPAFGTLHRPANRRMAVSFFSEYNVEYHVEHTLSLKYPVWERVSFALTEGGPAVHRSVHGSGSPLRIAIPAADTGAHYYRIVVEE